MASAQDAHLTASTNSHRGGAMSDTSDSESLTPLEQEVLDEYARLLGNLNNVLISLSHPSMHSIPSLPSTPVTTNIY